MLPIVTPEEMAAIDAAAPQPVEVLIDRAGAAIAWAARTYLGGTYGRRIAVLAGPGNNGADGRVAAERLRRWGAQVLELDPSPERVPDDVHLWIDAAFGTGLSRPYHGPVVGAPVLAVDIPSGISGLTGEVLGTPMAADLTVTFQALKPGLILHPGAMYCPNIEVADIGLDVTGATAHLVERADVAALLPWRSTTAHKWRSACWVVGGSPGMTGAAELAAAGAARAGAGYVRLSVPGQLAEGPVEAVGHELSATGWAATIRGADIARFGSMVLGPGLGRGPDTNNANTNSADTNSADTNDADTAGQVIEALSAPLPMVLDGDGLAAVAGRLSALVDRPAPTVLTPHDGEYALLAGSEPGPDRIAAARELASATASTVLLKGPTTVVAAPDGRVLVSNTGDARLATAGTGDVLAGIIGALLAQGLPALEAAAVGAWLHGTAGQSAPAHGMVASDLLATLPEVLHETHMG